MTHARRLPAPHVDLWDWQMRAACRGLDSEVFFHPSEERGRSRTVREEKAKDICRGCPVLQDCRRYALAARESYGVWGGLSEEERRTLLSTRPATPRRRP